MNLLKYASIVGGAAMAVTLMVGTPASAASCLADDLPADILLGVDPNSDCFVGTTGVGGSGNDSESILNGASVFGQTDWEQIAKDNGLNGTDEGDASALTVTGTLVSGTLTIADSVFDMFNQVAVVLKSGGGNVNPEFWVAYLVEQDTDENTIVSTYSYLSIFDNASNSEDKNLSHIALYGANKGDGGGGCEDDDPTCVPPIPLPAGLPLILAGVGALGILRMHRKRS